MRSPSSALLPRLLHARARPPRGAAPGLAGLLLAGALLPGLAACSTSPGEGDVSALPEQGEVVTPPFEVRGDAEGLLLVWFDADGPHTASRRSEIPQARRAMVRVEDLDTESPLAPGMVYVADLRAARPDGTYEVRRLARDGFEARVAEAARAGRAAGEDVVVYGASWCSACRSTAAFLRERGVPFVERDVEREPDARRAMQEAARAAGVSPTGIPVIDFRGEIITGFDRGALERAIQRSGGGSGAGAPGGRAGAADDAPAVPPAAI